jgi:uncharacterized protein
VYVYELYCEDKLTKTSIRLKEWFPKDTISRYRDSRAKPGNTYRYYIKVYDQAGNVAEDATQEIYFETGIRPPVTSLQFTVDRQQKHIALYWQYTGLEASKCLIYRAKAGEPLRLYKTIPGNPGEFVDKDLAINNTYTYKISLKGKAGLQTQLSEALRVDY